MTSAADLFPIQKNHSSPFFSWPSVLLQLMLLALLAVGLAKPTGSISGQLALQQEGFNLYSYDMREHHVYAIAIGPRGGTSQERGVWVNDKGAFRIDNLPVGEYELKVHVPGFATSFDSGIFVEEGKVAELGHDIALELSTPSVSLASNTRVFTTKETPRFWANTNGSTQLTINVYKKDMLQVLTMDAKKKLGFEITPELVVYKPYDAPGKKAVVDFFKGMAPVQTWKRTLTTDSQDYSRAEFKFDKPLPPGDYFAMAEAKNIQQKSDWHVIWFSVSDIGLVVKRDPWKTVVRAIDLNTLHPLQNVDVQLLDRSNKGHLLAKGVTGADGFVTISVKAPKSDAAKSSAADDSEGAQAGGNNQLSMIAYGSLAGSHAYGGLNYYGGSSDAYQTYFYTDRPVYRLGQTVYYKGICRAQKLEGFKNPGVLKLDAFIEDPDNNQIWSGKVATNAHGTFNGLFEIPKDSKTGAYQMTVKFPDGTQSYERFEVAEYRKPEYQVEVTAAEPRIIAGHKGKARIHATYYFGAPVANAKVKYTVFSSIDWGSRYSLQDRPSYYGFFDGWDRTDEYDSGYNGDYVSEGTATTDDNGEAVVEFDTKRGAFDKDKPYEYDRYDHRYKVEAEVTDISRLSVVGSGSLQATEGNFALFVTPTNYIAKVGQPVSADFNVVSYAAGHKPVANVPVTLKLYRRVYDHKTYTYKGIETYEQVTVQSDANGKGHVDFQTKPEFVTDNYDIIATATDEANNVVADDSSVWVVSENYPYALSGNQAVNEPLTIKLDKDVYKSGDTAKIMITAPVTGAEGTEAIVSIEGAKIYSIKAVPMKATAQLVEIPLTVDYAPNVYVTVTFIGKKHQFYSQSQMIKVSPEARFLNVAIETDKPKYKPGDSATYTVTAKYADGKPAANTEVSLGVVDESIYAIRPEVAQDIRKFFYNRRENAVVTMCTFPEEYSGGPNKIEPRVRKDFKDTAAWLPNLVTDANGVAKTTIKMPDNLTTWRATARAVSMETEVGSSVQKVVSTQDLILRLALPRFFSQGDEGFITAVVHNYTDKPQGVTLTLTPSDQFQVKDKLMQKIVVFPDKAMRYSWPVKVLNPGQATVACKAVGDTAADAMETKLPVRPLGVEAFDTKSGIMTAEDQTVTVPYKLPSDAVPGSVKVHLYLSSSTLGPLLGNFSSLIDYPYGCTEQTMSKLMPSIVAVRLHQTIGAPLSNKDIAKFKEVYDQSMVKLDGYQHEDGGWGWWADDQSQIYLTALVLDGYSMLEDAKYNVPTERQTNGKAWLQKNSYACFKQLTDKLHKAERWHDNETMTDLSRAYYVLAKYKQMMPPDVKAWVMQQKDLMAPEALSYFTLALSANGDSEGAQTLYNRLLDLSNNVTGDFGLLTDWGPSKQLLQKLGWRSAWSYDWLYSYRYTDVETTALALQAVVAMEPDNFDRIEAIKRWILTQRSKSGWDNTKTTSEVFKALMASEIQARKTSQITDYSTDITVPGQTVAPHSFGKPSLFEKELDISLKPLKGNSITLHKKGAGRLYYTSVVEYYKSIKPGQLLAEKTMPDGLKIRREFFRLVPSEPDSNGNVHFKAVALPDRTVKAGETILMKMYVEAPTPLPYVCIEAPLPSGAEVVENDSRGNATEANADKKNDAYSWGNWWWNHQDVMDDHLAFFVTNFPTGKCELHQMIRMEIPGKFEMNPISLAGMYSKAVRGYSQSDEITVVEK